MVGEINEIDYAGFYLLAEWGSPPPTTTGFLSLHQKSIPLPHPTPTH